MASENTAPLPPTKRKRADSGELALEIKSTRWRGYYKVLQGKHQGDHNDHKGRSDKTDKTETNADREKVKANTKEKVARTKISLI